jgi:hypothetical protein
MFASVPRLNVCIVAFYFASTFNHLQPIPVSAEMSLVEQCYRRAMFSLSQNPQSLPNTQLKLNASQKLTEND